MTPPAEKPKRGLGRGLDALFADGEQRIEDERNERREVSAPAEIIISAPPTPPVAAAPEPVASLAPPPVQSGTRQLPITVLIPGPFQPRRRFDEAEMKTLSDSIRVHGILQPLLVRPSRTE